MNTMLERSKAMLATLASVRFNFRRTTQVIYKAPGYLHGTYMLEKRGAVSHADLVNHALDMRYGPGTRSLRSPGEVNSIVIEIVSVVV